MLSDDAYEDAIHGSLTLSDCIVAMPALEPPSITVTGHGFAQRKDVLQQLVRCSTKDCRWYDLFPLLAQTAAAMQSACPGVDIAGFQNVARNIYGLQDYSVASMLRYRNLLLYGTALEILQFPVHTSKTKTGMAQCFEMHKLQAELRQELPHRTNTVVAGEIRAVLRNV